jgi:hypothetical protein
VKALVISPPSPSSFPMEGKRRHLHFLRDHLTVDPNHFSGDCNAARSFRGGYYFGPQPIKDLSCKVPYDIIPVIDYLTQQIVFLVRADSPFKTMKEVTNEGTNFYKEFLPKVGLVPKN